MNTVALLDLEGTLVHNEFLEDMAKVNGTYAKVSEITKNAMAGNIDYNKAFDERIELVKGLKKEVALELLKKARLRENANQLVNWLHEKGCKTVILTNGFGFFAKDIAGQLHIDKVYANELVFDGNTLNTAVNSVNKDKIAREYLNKNYAVITIGDGANDIAMFKNSSLSIAIGNRKKVVDNADFCVNALDDAKSILEKPFYLVAGDVAELNFDGNILRFESQEELERRIDK